MLLECSAPLRTRGCRWPFGNSLHFWQNSNARGGYEGLRHRGSLSRHTLTMQASWSERLWNQTSTLETDLQENASNRNPARLHMQTRKWHQHFKYPCRLFITTVAMEEVDWAVCGIPGACASSRPAIMRVLRRQLTL